MLFSVDSYENPSAHRHTETSPAQALSLKIREELRIIVLDIKVYKYLLTSTDFKYKRFKTQML